MLDIAPFIKYTINSSTYIFNQSTCSCPVTTPNAADPVKESQAVYNKLDLLNP